MTLRRPPAKDLDSSAWLASRPLLAKPARTEAAPLVYARWDRRVDVQVQRVIRRGRSVVHALAGPPASVVVTAPHGIGGAAVVATCVRTSIVHRGRTNDVRTHGARAGLRWPRQSGPAAARATAGAPSSVDAGPSPRAPGPGCTSPRVAQAHTGGGVVVSPQPANAPVSCASSTGQASVDPSVVVVADGGGLLEAPAGSTALLPSSDQGATWGAPLTPPGAPATAPDHPWLWQDAQSHRLFYNLFFGISGTGACADGSGALLFCFRSVDGGKTFVRTLGNPGSDPSNVDRFPHNGAVAADGTLYIAHTSSQGLAVAISKDGSAPPGSSWRAIRTSWRRKRATSPWRTTAASRRRARAATATP